MDRLISQLPFFDPEHRTLAQSVATFVEQEVEPHAGVEDDVDGLAKYFVSVLAQAGLLRYAVATPQVEVRSLCLIREALAYSSALADLAFVMQGLGTFAISKSAPDHVREFLLLRALECKAIETYILNTPESCTIANANR